MPLTNDLRPEQRDALDREIRVRGVGPVARELGLSREVIVKLVAALPIQRGTAALARERLAERAAKAAQPPSAALPDSPTPPQPQQNKTPGRPPSHPGSPNNAS